MKHLFEIATNKTRKLFKIKDVLILIEIFFSTLK